MDDVAGQRPHIGIVAGTAEGAALCYRILCQEAEGVTGHQYAHPEVTLHSFPLPLYLDAIDRDDWAGVAGLMSKSAGKLLRAGADVIICPNNTLHRVFDSADPPRPWLHIAHPMLAEIAARGWRRVGLLGTRTVMEEGIYSTRLKRQGVAVVTPEPDDRVRLHHVIRSELVGGVFTSGTRSFVQDLIASMAADGTEAVILGCTELPLLLSDGQAVLPLLDSTRLLAHAALRYRVRAEQGLDGKDLAPRAVRYVQKSSVA